ncbi:hypothetical protein THRCLA_05092 [Thraustotheca clavata]|uniref:HTH La-type RNA-binding domain-containing protein n=1 Tax=Thraustotheca clavata TaxID=74557 RepID=A0A1V9ZWY9_9STRA|nr:hypothetical protein THRCLA_05092 [Thraustotheca clavata]
MSTSNEPQLVGAALNEALKKQVEFYFSKANLANDSYLVAQMNAQMYVPIDVILGFAKVKALSEDPAKIVQAIRDSQVCSLNEEQNAIKPNIKSERNTIILREIPSDTAPADVEAIFKGCGAVTNVRSDVGDTWFVTMASEDEAVKTLLTLRSKTFNNAPIKARLKSENLFKSFFPQSTPASTPAPAPVATSAYSVGMYGASGYYGAPANYGYAGKENRPRKGQGNFRAQNGSTKDAKDSKKGSTPSSKKNKDKKATTPAKKESKPKSERQPILNAVNFPPLPSTSGVITFSYSHDDIMEIVKHMDEADCVLPKGKMDFEAHAAALTPDAHPDLLRNQRTYSIEQAREALRQGRPIRSDSVGSVDYESMMYGEEYTKVARELRQQAQEKAAEEGVPVAKPETKSSGGYAAALINGAAAPPPAPKKEEKKEEKKKEAEATTKPAEKKTKSAPAPKKEAKKAEAPAAPATGAWGARSFLDIVKEPKKDAESEE